MYIRATVVDFGDESHDTQIAVARDPRTRVPLLYQLAQGADPILRRAVAQNPSAPVDLLNQLVNDSYDGEGSSYDEIRLAVYLNPNTPDNLATILEQDLSYDAFIVLHLEISEDSLAASLNTLGFQHTEAAKDRIIKDTFNNVQSVARYIIHEEYDLNVFDIDVDRHGNRAVMYIECELFSVRRNLMQSILAELSSCMRTALGVDQYKQPTYFINNTK